MGIDKNSLKILISEFKKDKKSDIKGILDQSQKETQRITNDRDFLKKHLSFQRKEFNLFLQKMIKIEWDGGKSKSLIDEFVEIMRMDYKYDNEDGIIDIPNYLEIVDIYKEALKDYLYLIDDYLGRQWGKY